MAKTLLLADDSATIRRVVELAFGDSDVRVEVAASGQEAWERWQQSRPDVVLADVVMPEPSGYELCRLIKASTRPVPVLLLAGTFEPYDKEQARDCGADGLLVKPFESRTLTDTVIALLARAEAHPAELVAPAAETAELEQAIAELTQSAGLASEPEPFAAPEQDIGLSPEQLENVVREVVRRLSADAVREIAREVVPEIAERVIRQKMSELAKED